MPPAPRAEPTLRRGGPADAEALTALFLRARREAMPYLRDLYNDAEVGAWMRGVVLAEEEVWVAELGDAPAGFVALRGDLVAHLYVDPPHQSRGVGTALLERAKERRPAGFQLWVFQRNERARRFYERHGLEAVEFGDGSFNEERVPDVKYEWRPRARPGSHGR